MINNRKLTAKNKITVSTVIKKYLDNMDDNEVSRMSPFLDGVESVSRIREIAYIVMDHIFSKFEDKHIEAIALADELRNALDEEEESILEHIGLKALSQKIGEETLHKARLTFDYRMNERQKQCFMKMLEIVDDEDEAIELADATYGCKWACSEICIELLGYFHPYTSNVVAPDATLVNLLKDEYGNA